MRQMNVPEEMKVKIDFSAPGIPSSVKMFRPLVFHDGDAFCCVLGPDPQLGVFGCGETLEKALTDWDGHLKEQISQDRESDVSKYIVDTLEASPEKVW
jgi:hypothetical protein